MGIATSPRVGWAVAAFSGGVMGFWLVVGGPRDIGRFGLRTFIETYYANVVWAVAFPVVGALILSRIPGHRLGLLYCLVGLACAVILASYSYAERGLVDKPGSLPGAVAAAWVSSWVWMLGVSPLLTVGVLAFPDGRLPSRRWWPVPAVTVLAFAVGLGSIALRPGPLENHPVHANPLGLPLPRSWFLAIGTAWMPLLAIAVVASFVGLAVRYRRASAGEREQLRWFLVAVGLLLVSAGIPADSPVGLVGLLLTVLSLPLLPLSVGVAVLRHRLYDAGTTLRRSLVYGWLIAVGLAVYAGVVLTLDTILRGHAQPAVALVGAGAVAVLYQPLRIRLQRAANEMLYGDRGDPYAVLALLGRRLEASGSAELTLPATVSAIAAALRLPYVAIEFPGDRPRRPTAVHGAPPETLPLSIPLVHGGEDVGRLLIGLRDIRPDLTAAERRLLGDVARQVAVAAHAVLLDRALRRSRERLVVSRESERRRIRRDLHDGLGPALAGMALGLDAARNLLRDDREVATDLLGELRDEALGCVDEVRRIVDDLRPPTLDGLGLLPALQAFADRLSQRDRTLRVDVISVTPMAELPAAVEVAAYRIATEAMTNVARHAHARTCTLRLDVTDDLVVAVSDDGVGLPAQRLPGVGLPSMSERAAELGGDCVVGPATGGGTLVLAHLPLAAA